MPELKSEIALKSFANRNRSGVGGLWSLSYDTLVLVDAAWSGRPVVLVPSETVRILAVDLPIANRTQRAAALPFAIEDELAEPLEALHVALGVELSPGRHLAGAVRHERMATWCAIVDEAGLGEAMLMPDALALPQPPADGWAVAAFGDRILARTFDGPAFAAPLAAFETLWRTAGEPRLASYGEPLAFAAPLQDLGWSSWPTIADPALLNLRQGRYAPASRTSPWVRRAAMVVGLGLLAHVALFALDTVGLMRSAEAKRAAVAALVVKAGGLPGGDLAVTAQAMLPQGSGDAAGLLPLFSRASQALLPLAASVSLQTVSYADDGGLILAVEASDLAGLQQAEAALTGAGLVPASSGSSVEQGRARRQMTLGAQGPAA